MHEYHIVEAAVKKVLETAKSNKAKKVTKVNLTMGQSSGFKETSVRLYFENFSKGTLLEDSELIIKSVPSKLSCKKCNILFEHKNGKFTCPKCGSLGTPGISDKELYIEDIEIEA